MSDSDITGLTANTTPAVTDVTVIVDDPAGSPTTQKITLADLLKVINGLTEDTAPALTADYALVFDTSAGTAKKVELENIGGGKFIDDLGSKLTWNSATGYQLEAGEAYVNNERLTYASAIVKSSLSLSADLLYNVYLYNNSGTPAIEESTTAPVWDATLNAYKKTADATRRWMGYIITDASGNIRKFVHILSGGRSSEIIYVDGSVTGKSAVSSGSTTGSWASFTMTTLVPVPATHYFATPKLIGTSANDDATAGISPIDLSSAVGNLAPFTVRFDNDVAGAGSFPGSFWFNISTAQTNYYRITHNVGTGSTLTVQVHGSRFVR